MYRLIIISLLILQSLIFSQRSQQDFQKELDAQSSAIQSLKDEIKATQKRIQSENRKEKSSVRRVSNLSEEISLCLLYTSPSPRDGLLSRMPSSA